MLVADEQHTAVGVEHERAHRLRARSARATRQLAKATQPLGVRDGGVRRRGRGQDEQPRRPERPQLGPELGPLAERTAVGLLADERDGTWCAARGCALEGRPVEVAAPQVARTGRRPVRGVRHAVRRARAGRTAPAGRKRRGVKPASCRSRQKSLRGFAKCAAAAAETRPGLIPQKTHVRSGAEDVGDGLGVEAIGVLPRGLQRGTRCVHVAVHTHELGSGGAGRAPGRHLRSAAGARSTSGRCASCRLRLGPTHVEALLEPLAQLLSRQGRRACTRRGAEPHDAHPFVAVPAVDPRVALGFGERPEPHAVRHPRTGT